MQDQIDVPVLALEDRPYDYNVLLHPRYSFNWSDDPPRKGYRCHQTIVVKDVASKFSEKCVVESNEFFALHDPYGATFKLELHLGRDDGYFGVFIRNTGQDKVLISLFKFELFDETESLAENSEGESFNGYVVQGNCLCGWPDFYEPEDPTKARVWRVWCEFTYEVLPQPEPSQASRLPIQNDLLRLLEEPTSSDVTFSVGEQKFKAHKVILSARSEYFSDMFKTDTNENVTGEVKVEDVEPKIFKWMLEFLYSGSPAVLPTKGNSHTENLLQLLTLGSKYGLKDLEEACVKHLCKGMDKDCIADVLLLAHKLDNHELLKEAELAFHAFCDDYTLTCREMEKLSANPQILVMLLLDITTSSDVAWN